MAALRALRLPLANVRSPLFQDGATISSLRSICYSSKLPGTLTECVCVCVYVKGSLCVWEREVAHRACFTRMVSQPNLSDSTALDCRFQTQNLVMPIQPTESYWREWHSMSSRSVALHIWFFPPYWYCEAFVFIHNCITFLQDWVKHSGHTSNQAMMLWKWLYGNGKWAQHVDDLDGEHLYSYVLSSFQLTS
jgi:hypothetical protein